MFVLKKFLNEAEIKEILENLSFWQEGFTNKNKEHKDNYELVDEKYATYIARKIRQHPYASTKLFIKSMTLPRFNKYEPSQKYARHVDAYKQFGIQTDWSFTLMLQPPEEGGELEIEVDNKISKIKLDAGDIVVYPSGNIHQVIPVVKGERIAAIGWIESLITRPDQRSILSKLIETFQSLEKNDENKEEVLKLSYVYHNLLRLWSK